VPRSNQILERTFPLSGSELIWRHGTYGRKGEDGILWVTPPSFRGDLAREIDLVEEVARMEGYDQVPVTLPKVRLRIFRREEQRIPD